jgi:hypothetical protein
LTADETDRLYAGYRGDAYFRERHRHEWWYSRKINDDIGRNPQEIESRKQAVEAFLRKHVDWEAVETVLDYGGDRGQFIPESLGKKKYVFEISAAVPVEGVTRIASAAGLGAGGFDFIMLCHVLEHCSDPCATLRAFKELGRGAESLYYIEVPYERFDLTFAGRGALYERYLGALTRFRLALQVVDFYSTVLRTRWNLIPPFGLIKCHEHLNYFNEKSLALLLQNNGFDIVACTAVALRPRSPLKTKVLQAVARRRLE